MTRPPASPRTPLTGTARRASLTLCAAAALTLAACAPGTPASDGTATDTTISPTATDTASPTASPTAGAPGATATLVDTDGTEVGTATFTETGSAVRVEVRVESRADALVTGFHGLHIHTVGQCEPNSAAPNAPDTTGAFLSAGGHLGGGGDTSHPEHAGDLPSLLVLDDGTAHLVFDTDRFVLPELDDADGAALMIHGAADNFANIPERYAADGPDQDTRNTGDAGARVACGVIEFGS